MAIDSRRPFRGSKGFLRTIRRLLFGARSLATYVAAFCGGSAFALGPQLGQGSWSGPWTWIPTPAACHEVEFAHAALIPVGALKGLVLLWKDTDCAQQTAESWVFEPSNPGTLSRLPTDFETNIFCSGLSWNWQGHLVVTGGIRGNMQGTPMATYRFNPLVIGGHKVYPIPPCGPCNPHYYLQYPYTSPWEFVDDMSIPRYYATLVPLNRRPIQSTGTLVGPGTSAPAINGSGHLVLGGPPIPAPVLQTINDGNDLWQIFDPVTDMWSHTMAPVSPQFTFAGNAEVYEEQLSASTVEERLDTYPRAFQLADPDPLLPTVDGQVFVVNDVDSDYDPTALPPNTPGSSWVIKPPLATPNGNWQLWHGATEPHDPEFCAGGPASPNCFKDRFYGTAVLMHTLADKNRVLVFGGSQDPDYPPSCPSTWWVNNSVWEHELGTDPTNPVVLGNWRQKTSLEVGRVFLNAVILPTGQILIVGGDRIDTAINHNDAGPEDCTSVLGPLGDPVFEPELYDPGQSPSSAGSTRTLAIPPGTPTPRRYHHLAVLLPDGSVLVAGGDGPTSSFSGELFNPPYLTLGPRPVIMGGSRAVSFSTSSSSVQFDLDVTVFNPQIAKVVLLRPAALTHHFDNDQRYIELEFSVDPYPLPDPSASVTLNITTPEETLGPAGYYMLFVVEVKAGGDPLNLDDLIPSHGEFIRLKKN